MLLKCVKYHKLSPDGLLWLLRNWWYHCNDNTIRNCFMCISVFCIILMQTPTTHVRINLSHSSRGVSVAYRTLSDARRCKENWWMLYYLCSRYNKLSRNSTAVSTTIFEFMFVYQEVYNWPTVKLRHSLEAEAAQRNCGIEVLGERCSNFVSTRVPSS